MVGWSTAEEFVNRYQRETCTLRRDDNLAPSVAGFDEELRSKFWFGFDKMGLEQKSLTVIS